MNVADVDLNLLVAFEALYAERNVTLAARRLGITQPAMSNALRRLRLLLQDPVFVRTPSGMAPTPRALAIGPAIAGALNSLRATLSATGFEPLRSAARFSVATLDYLEALYFPKVLAKLAVVAPGVSINVRRLGAIYEVPQQQLESGAIDCAFGLFPQPMTPQSSLHAEVVGQEDWVCLARRGHPALRRRLTLKAYAGLKHLAITYPEVVSGQGMMDRLLAARGLARTCVASLPHFTTLPFHVAQTDCVATLPRRLASFFARALPLQMAELPLAPRTSPISLIWHSRVEEDPAQGWFRRVVIEAVRLDLAAGGRRVGVKG